MLSSFMVFIVLLHLSHKLQCLVSTQVCSLFEWRDYNSLVYITTTCRSLVESLDKKKTKKKTWDQHKRNSNPVVNKRPNPVTSKAMDVLTSRSLRLLRRARFRLFGATHVPFKASSDLWPDCPCRQQTARLGTVLGVFISCPADPLP